MKRVILLSIFLIGGSWRGFSQSSGIQKSITFTPDIAIQNFDWLERSTIGKVGFQVQAQPIKKINLTIGGGVFKSIARTDMGYTDRGHFSSSTALDPILGQKSSIPQVAYQGGFANIDAGIPMKLGGDSSRTTIEPFVGIEAKMWNRVADYGTDGNPMLFEEKYKFLSPALGAKLNYATKSKVKVSLRISTSYPVVSKLKMDEKNLNLPNTELDLTKMLSPSVELGLRVKKVTIKLRYERINIGTSDSIRGYVSPASRANVTGLSIGYDF